MTFEVRACKISLLDLLLSNDSAHKITFLNSLKRFCIYLTSHSTTPAASLLSRANLRVMLQIAQLFTHSMRYVRISRNAYASRVILVSFCCLLLKILTKATGENGSQSLIGYLNDVESCLNLITVVSKSKTLFF